jgi:rubrerythrin
MRHVIEALGGWETSRLVEEWQEQNRRSQWRCQRCGVRWQGLNAPRRCCAAGPDWERVHEDNRR